MFEVKQQEPDHLSLTFSSQHEHLDALVNMTEDFVRAFSSDDDLIYKISLLTTEAVTNAIEHGNQLDHSKSVHVDLRKNATHFEVCVLDEGTGFDQSSVKNPTDTENLLEDGGRGIFFMEQMADEVHFELEGRRVRIVFNV